MRTSWFLRAPELEVWQRADGSWNWVMIDRPTPLQPAVVLWDSTPWPNAHAALADADRVMDRWIREAGF